MKRPITPQLFLLSALAGWLNRQQQRVLDYLRGENRVLGEQLGLTPIPRGAARPFGACCTKIQDYCENAPKLLGYEVTW